jgi:serine/threonine protein kinase
VAINVDSLGLPDEIANEVVRLSTTYEFEKLSDKGQNGYLFMAFNTVLKRRVAIKFYFWADGSREHIEPQSLASVQSQNVIEVLDAAFVGDEWAMFVTPFCENGDVDRFREKNRFGLRESIRFAAGLLDGVASLHQRGFVHRDLKPENLLVSHDRCPLIADFGSVRYIPDGQPDVSGSGHAVLYRPPESFATARYDRRGDLYQCGIVLFQILGGRLPYSYHEYLTNSEREQYLELMDDFERSRLIESAISKKASAGTLLDYGSLPAFVPTQVKTVIKRAVNVDPDKRFQSASDFMNKLNSLTNKVVDWRYENSAAVAISNGTKFRVSQDGTNFVAEQDKGKGWRRIPRVEPSTKNKMIKEIETRVGR